MSGREPPIAGAGTGWVGCRHYRARMGRLDQGFEATRLGAHVDLEAQRALLALRGSAGVKTQLIVASLRDWRTVPRVAGCDVFTEPCGVLEDFLRRTEVPPEALTSRLETSYEDRLDVRPDVVRKVGIDRLATGTPMTSRCSPPVGRRGVPRTEVVTVARARDSGVLEERPCPGSALCPRSPR